MKDATENQTPPIQSIKDVLDEGLASFGRFKAFNAEAQATGAKLNRLRDTVGKLKERIAALEGRQREQLQAAERANPNEQPWTPQHLGALLLPHFPGCDMKVSGPSGIYNNFTIVFRDPAATAGQPAAGRLCVRFDEVGGTFRLSVVDTSSDTGQFPATSMAAMGGGNHETIDVTADTDLAELVKMAKR